VSRDGAVWWSLDHASYAGTAPGARAGRGIVAGVPDLFVLRRGIAHMVEVKTPAGELSDPQQSVMAAVLASGGVSAWCATPRRCWGLLDAWGIPRQGAALGGAWECGGTRSAIVRRAGTDRMPPPGGRLNGKANGTGLAN
jgi:hypothetical protein